MRNSCNCQLPIVHCGNIINIMAKKITNEELVRMSQKEFLGIGKRFDKVDGRFDKVDEDSALLRHDMDAGFAGIGETLKSMQEDLKGY